MRLTLKIAIILFFAASTNVAKGQSYNYTRQHFNDTLVMLFKVAKSNIIPQFYENSRTLAQIQQLNAKINNKNAKLNNINLPISYEFAGISIQGTASPEGARWFNENLAKSRAASIEKYLNRQLGIQGQITIEPHKVYEMEEVSNMHPGKNYNELYKNIYPQLRSSRLILKYTRTYEREPIAKDSPYFAQAQAKMAQPAQPAQAHLTQAHQTLAHQAQTQQTQTNQTQAHQTRIQRKADVPQTEEAETGAKRDRLALKTNLLYDAIITPNIGLEYVIGKKTSVAGNWMYAWWKKDSRAWYHRVYGGDIELRRWFGQKLFSNSETITPFEGWHLGIYGQIAQYDFEWGEKGNLTYKWSYGGGIAAGWSKAVGKRVRMDFTLGLGYFTGEYEVYRPLDACYVWQATRQRRWFGPTKAEIALVWIIAKGNTK